MYDNSRQSSIGKGCSPSTGHTQKNGAVLIVNSLLKPHHSFVYALYIGLSLVSNIPTMFHDNSFVYHLRYSNSGIDNIVKNTQQKRQCTCNVTLSRVRVTIVAVEKQ
jgi:hypothetical protein